MVVPEQPPHPDHSDVEACSQRLLEYSQKLAAMAPDVANARTVKEYDSERRKRSLALRVREYLADGDSASAAETKGRASIQYGEDLERLCREMASAEKIIAEYDATLTGWKTAQSVLSCLKNISTAF